MGIASEGKKFRGMATGKGVEKNVVSSSTGMRPFERVVRCGSGDEGEGGIFACSRMGGRGSWLCACGTVIKEMVERYAECGEEYVRKAF